MKSLVVTGDMGFDDKDFAFENLDRLQAKVKQFKPLLTGRANLGYLGNSHHRQGAEHWAAEWCGKRLVCYAVYFTDRAFTKKDKPDYRLEQMFADADGAVFFWDGKDRETKDLIRMAKKYLVTCWVLKYTRKKKWSNTTVSSDRRRSKKSKGKKKRSRS